MRTSRERGNWWSRASRFVSQQLDVRNRAIYAIASGLYCGVAGFVFGNALGAGYGLQFKEWQTLFSACIALAGITIGYMGVRGTQRINVILKEQERLDKLLPGLRQSNDFIGRLSGYLGGMTGRTRYMSYRVIRDFLQPGENETIEDIVRRRVRLADDDLQREIQGRIGILLQAAEMLKVAKHEHDSALKELAQIDRYAEEVKPDVRRIAEMQGPLLERAESDVAAEIEAMRDASESLAKRLSEAEERRRSIGDELSVYFIRH